MLKPAVQPSPLGKIAVSAAMVLVSAAYGLWQNFAAPEPRKRLYAFPAKLAAVTPRPAAPASAQAAAPAAPPQQVAATPQAATPAPSPVSKEAANTPPAKADAKAAEPAYVLPAMAQPPRPSVPPPSAPTTTGAPYRMYAFTDGDYTGTPAECEWGTVQVKVAIRGGNITDVQFLQMPNHRDRSAEISEWAAPALTSETIKEQNYDVDVVSSATFTSQAFQQTLYTALQQARK